ncbi:MAG: hypothetical protein LUG65_00800, partial [Clostridiales bacterium]|nr:hypothetical protein [Clostridiales bacterium]
AMVVPDYLIYTMTGSVATDRTYGSRTLLMNLASGQWDDELCSLFSIEKDKLCSLIEVGEVAGQVSESFAAATGLTAGTPVVTAGGDQQCAALGLGVFDPSAVAINCGTGAYAIGVSDVPILDNPGIICNRASVPGKYIVEASVSRCATALNAFITQTYPEFGGDMERLNHEVEFGTDQRAKQARALYESVAAGIADCVARIPHGEQITCYLSGGVSNSDIFNRILAKAVGHPLIRWNDPEATAIGAFISGAVALGVYPDYDAAFQAARAEDTKAVYLP